MEDSIWRMYKENPTIKLKQKLMVGYLDLIHYVIHKSHFRCNFLEYDDYFQFGFEGLNEAIDRFNPDFGTKFETYAIQRIQGKIMDELRKLLVNKGRPEAPDLSLNESLPGCEEIGQLYEMISNGEDSAIVLLERDEAKKKILWAINELGRFKRIIFYLYYYRDWQYDRIAKLLDMTVSRVSQLHADGMDDLKNIIISSSDPKAWKEIELSEFFKRSGISGNGRGPSLDKLKELVFESFCQ